MPSAEASAPVNRVAADAVPTATATSVPAPAAPVDAVMQTASPATPAAPLVGNAAPLANDIAVAANAPQQFAQPAQAQNAQAQNAQAQNAHAPLVNETPPVPAQPAVQAQAAIQAQSAQVQSAQVQPAQVQSVQVQSVPSGPALRTTAAGPRATFTPAARRVVDAAVQSARPAEALAAVFDRADLDIDPAASLARTDFAAPPMMEAIPPSWAAALNAVSSPSQQLAGVAAPQASAQANATPMETLNFDAGFVANIETQIARVANGGQTVRMQIMPENLGRIDIEMLAGPERDQVRIVTEHDAVRDTLVSSQHRLEQDLRSNAQRPTEVTVELRQQSPGTQNGSAQQQQQRSQAGADTASARDAGQRQAAGDPAADAAPAARRPRGNVRYA
jgi:flagellar hook-length control protein FliK